ncbi:hypothetical protein F5882DRAFT_262810, partial [Hyaloscypha sp. PMI_1271]
MAISRGTSTYRVRLLPSHLDRHGVVRLLSTLLDGLEPDNIQILSLARSVNPWERPPTKTATVMFGRLPTVLDSDHDEWVLESQQAGLERNIMIDTHFLGLTALNDVQSENVVFDCIALSGLASHPFGSWKQPGPKGDFMWIRDSLPKDLPEVRCIIYGYDTKLVKSESFQDIDDLASSFITSLKSAGQSSLSSNPLVFLAHSLGGIILKQSLRLLANCGEAERYILGTVRAAIFFGVPNRGMRMSYLLPMVEGRPNEKLIQQLGQGSYYLPRLREQSNGIAVLRRIRMVSAYETQRSRTVQQSENGEWTRTGPYEILVDRESAIQDGSRPSDAFPINQDHSGMVKFAEDDPSYRIVVGYMLDIWRDLKPQQKSPSAMTVHSGDDDSGEIRDQTPQPPELTSSLHTTPLATRFDEIEKVDRASFQWLYDNSELRFESWLREGHGIYWIAGKPGSGKSTLMKYIYDHRRTNEILHQWRKRRQIQVRFFFHHRGTHLQKSFEGLLRSVLYQILVQEQTLAEDLLPIYLGDRADNDIGVGLTRWSIEHLERAFTLILEQKKLPLDIYLFVDALDEYDGSHLFIGEFFKSLVMGPNSAATRVKILFSSRPWSVFNDLFGSCAGFAIHNYTRGDIRDFVTGKIRNDRQLNELLYSPHDQGRSNLERLTSEIIKRAEGVFLWVKLVMENLLRTSTTASCPHDLETIVSTFPDELEDLYVWIIKRIPASFRPETYTILEITHRSTERQSLIDYINAIQCAPCQTLHQCTDGLILKELSPEKIDDFKRFIKSRCGGLVELVGSDQHLTLQLMHQTVKDFIGKSEFQRTISGLSGAYSYENGYSFLAKYFLADLFASAS